MPNRTPAIVSVSSALFFSSFAAPHVASAADLRLENLEVTAETRISYEEFQRLVDARLRGFAPDGRVLLDGDGDGPPFDKREQGAFWQITGPKNTVRTGWLGDTPVALPDMPPPSREGRPVSVDMAGPEGRPVHARVLRASRDGVVLVTLVAAPLDAIDGPMRGAMTTIGIAMAGLGAALVLATLVQVRHGLRPLRRLRDQIAAVRSGLETNLPTDQPREVLPLVTEMNVLLDQNAANLVRARRHVANLAHGLKTPLATLSLAVDRSGDDQRDALRALVGLIERRIRHHLGRARAAALDGPVRSQTILAPRLRDLVDVMLKLHADKGLSLILDCPAGLAIACEPQDVDEIFGNLLENAFKWARAEIRCGAEAEGADVSIAITDDGPGLKTEEIERVMRIGQRLDEAVPGFGFGLPIARELTELYGGELTLAPQSRGLRVTIRLPKA